ncbi:MAG: alpha/beta hydrolase [Nitrosopumilus sp.]|nr:alpha/beta hydrolase [Nitrosopumilus sp.]
MQVKRFFKYFGIGIAILIGGVLVAGQIAHYSVPVVEPPGKIYSVNGTEMHLYCTGPENDAQPTVIIITGAGTPSPLYHPLQEDLSQSIRTCSYDRAGTGWSESNNIPANAKNMSDELYQLLQVANIDGPIILAGHSLGGIVSLIYSSEHEDHVAGIAFIDSSHYNQYDYFGNEFRESIYAQNKELAASFWLVELVSKSGILNLMGFIMGHPAESVIDEDIQRMVVYFDTWAPPYDAVKSEIVNLELSFEQGREAHYNRGDLPIISISASDHDMTFFPKTGPTEQEMDEAFQSFREELADLSNNGRHVVVEGTDHISIVYNEDTAEHILSLIGDYS